MNWQIHQGLALQGQPEKARRVNYNFERLGLPVKNQKLILEVHDTSCTDWELKLFTTDNLAKAHGAYTRAIQDSSQASGIAHRDEFPEIPSNGQETGRTAWFNWVLVRHPFSLFSPPSRNDLTYFLFRSTGSFTRPCWTVKRPTPASGSLQHSRCPRWRPSSRSTCRTGPPVHRVVLRICGTTLRPTPS